MSQADSLTALVDYYGLKKEGKVTGEGDPSLGASGKVKATGVMPILQLLDTKAWVNILPKGGRSHFKEF